MVDLTIERSVHADALELASAMRQQDIDEVHACGHTDLHAVVADGITRSALCWTARVDGRMGCVFGVAPMSLLTSQRGAPWMLGTDEVPRHAALLMRRSPEYIAKMLDFCPVLVNTVHAKNTVSLRWLKRMGFEIGQRFVMNNEPFYLFGMTRHV